MSNKHFCQGPSCHVKTTQDRFLKSRGVVRGRYALWTRDTSNEYHSRCKYFCSTACENEWLNENMENIEQGRSIEFIDTEERVKDMRKKLLPIQIILVSLIQVVQLKGLTTGPN